LVENNRISVIRRRESVYKGAVQRPWLVLCKTLI